MNYLGLVVTWRDVPPPKREDFQGRAIAFPQYAINIWSHGFRPEHMKTYNIKFYITYTWQMNKKNPSSKSDKKWWKKHNLLEKD